MAESNCLTLITIGYALCRRAGQDKARNAEEGIWEPKLKATVTESTTQPFITASAAHGVKAVSRAAHNESHE